MPRAIRFLLLSSFVLLFVLTGCDSAGTGGSGDTAVLNANSPVPPTVEYEFRFNTTESTNGVVSSNADDLSSILSENGFGRSDVVSARVDSVVLIRRSPKQAKSPQPKVFDFLSGAEVFLGSDASGTRIADDQFDVLDRVSLNVATSDVTQEIRDGSKRAFLRLDLETDPNREDRVEVDVFYRIEVEL